MLRTVPLMGLAAIAALPAAAAEVTLSTDGQTAYTILVDPAATEAEKHAATELSTILSEVTGAVFPLETGTAVGDGPLLVVGPGRAAQDVAPDLDLDTLRPDGLVIETRMPHLILAGDRPRGTLYAVYQFLEDVVGCRFWTPTARTIPHRPTLRFEEVHRRFVPALEYRETFWWDAFDGDWAARNKSNGNRPRLTEAHGGKVSYGGPFFVHTFNQIAPPETYFEDHPEWFSEINGERVGANGERTQLCVTNEELKEFAVQQVMGWIEQNPGAMIFSVSQNDWDRHCLCPECRALEEQEGSPAGPLLHFVNYIAERVADKYPDVAIDTLAYQYTRKAPRHVKPLPNVIVRLCSIECNFLEPLEGESNRSFREDIEAWNQICDRLYIWDYTTNFSHYIQPHPNLRVLGPNIRFFCDHGVKGIFEQGAYQSPGAELAELKAWVIARLLWDPSRDPEALIDEFCTGYYQAAGPHIRRYIDELHDTAEASGHYLGIGSGPNAPFLSLELMAKAEELFNQAEAAVGDDAELLNRVRLARLPVRYIWAMRWHEFQAEAQDNGIDWPGPDSYTGNAETFMEIARANAVTKLSEGRSIESFAHRTIDLGRTESPVPPGCEDLAADRWVDLQDATFNLWQEGSRSKLVKDPQASDNVAAMTDGGHHEWAIQQRLSVRGLQENETYSVYVSARIDKVGDEGKAFTFGVYDADNRVFSLSSGVDCKDVEDSGYHTYKIGTLPVNRGMYLWVAPAQNPQNAENLYVDRFWLVREP